MIRRVAALSAVGGLVVGSLALGVAAPAHAASLIDYRAYQQTVPASVIDGGTLTDDEKVAWTNATRSGNVTTPTVPLGNVPTRSKGTLPGIFGGLGMLLMIGGEQHTEMTYGDDLWWKHSERPDWIPEDEWNMCSSGGDASNIFDGFADWTASFHGIAAGGSGYDCEAIREDWLLEKNPDYEPVGAAQAGASGYPASRTSLTFNSTIQLLQPVWSNAPTARTTDEPTRVEGWIVPVAEVQPGSYSVIQLRVQWFNSSGAAGASQQYSVDRNTGTKPSAATAPSVCATVTYCVSLDALGYTAKPAGAGLMANLVNFAHAGGGGTLTMPPLPYIDPTSGASPSPGELARQVLMTTVTTEAGNRYTCSSVSFVETAPTIPRPCEPEVPDWEIITERTVEIVPETEAPSYVPGSNPTRGIQTTTVPDVVRDWQRDFPDCDETLCLLDLELEGVGSCFDNPDECADWYTDPNKTTRYTCTYGGEVVDLSQCVKYARLFKPGAITSGTPYPAPGTTNPGSTTSPSSTPSGQTGSTPSTATAPGSSAQDPSKPRDCWPTGWGIFNPFEWVYKPVRCVLEWAFVPRDAYVQSVIRSMQLKWTSSSLVSLLAVLEEASDLFLSPGGCEGPTINLSIYGSSYSGHPLSACSQPMAGAAQFSFIFTGIAAWVMAIASIARSIAGVVAFKGIGGDST